MCGFDYESACGCELGVRDGDGQFVWVLEVTGEIINQGLSLED